MNSEAFLNRNYAVEKWLWRERDAGLSPLERSHDQPLPNIKACSTLKRNKEPV
jgi:hypothetical protein